MARVPRGRHTARDPRTAHTQANIAPVIFFGEEARRNSNHFATAAEADAALIYNYPVTYTAPHDPSFEQCYYFD